MTLSPSGLSSFIVSPVIGAISIGILRCFYWRFRSSLLFLFEVLVS